MFAACRPSVRVCDQGHPVLLGDEECEEGHCVDPGLSQANNTGILGHILRAVK